MSKRTTREDLATRLTTQARLESDRGRRVTARRAIRPVLLPSKLADKGIHLLNGGTIVTVVSRGQNEYLDGLAAAIKTGDAERTRVYCDAITNRTRAEYLKRRKPLDLTTAPAIIDVLYGHAWLAKDMVLAEDTSIALSCATWSGGKLDEKMFAVVQHSLDRKTPEMQVLTIMVPPQLSKVEKGVIRAVPATLSEIHVKGPSVSWTAAGLIAKWEQPVKGDDRLSTVANVIQVVPFYEQNVQETTMQQQQLQQTDTRQQQQQQQFQDNHTQQQQQQIQQQENQQQIQQQNQQNQEQVQQQQQQNQDQNDQHQFQDRHAADCAQQHDSGMFWDDLDGGLVFRQFEEEVYTSALQKIDFEALDATQSVKELVRLRERLITVGMP